MANVNRRASWRQLLVSLALLGAAAWYWITFGSNFGIFVHSVSGAAPLRQWLVLTVLKTGLSILTTAALLWALVWLLKEKRFVSDAGHVWLTAFVGGFLIILLTVLRGRYLHPADFYNQAFLVTRNAFPFITGLIVLVLLSPWLRKWAADWRFQAVGVLALSLPLLFNKDLFFFGNGLTLTGMVALGIMALVILSDSAKLSLKWLWLLAVAGVVSLIWIAAAYGRGASVVSGVRLLGPMSPFMVLPAMAIVKLLLRFSDGGAKVSPWLSKLTVLIGLSVFETAMLLSQGSYAQFAASQFQGLHNHLTFLGPLWSLAVAVIFAVIAIVLLAIAFGLLSLTDTWKSLDTYWQVNMLEAAGLIRQNGKAIGKRILRRYWRPVVAFCVLYAVQVSMCLLMNLSTHLTVGLTGRRISIFPVTMFSYTNRMIVGAIVLMSAYWLLLSLTNRYWVSLLSVSTLSMVFAVANRLKIISRNEPITPSDMSEINALPELSHMVSPVVWVLGVIGIVAIIAIIVLAERHSSSAQQSWRARLSKFVISLAFILSLGQLNAGYSVTRNTIESMGVWLNSINMLGYSQVLGPVMQFVTQLDVKVMNAPTGYSKQAIDQLAKKYQGEADTINKTRPNTLHDQTIMFNLSESLSDPARVPGLKLSADPIPYIHSLSKQATTGYMMSFGYGGGTADMEWMTLTGLNLGSFDANLQTPYTQLVTKLKQDPTIGTYFNYKSAIHPYLGNFYNRPAVYRKFKFNKFAYLGSKYKIIDQKAFGKSPYLSDTTAYANGLKQINARKGGQFINLITIQNHMPFTTNWYGRRDFKVSGSGFDPSKRGDIENYTQGIHETDKVVKIFKNKIDKIKKPIIWVFYGDHLAALYQSPNQVALHATDYFVYANKYARAHGALTKISGTSKYVAPSDFIALAAEQAGAKVNPYVALLTKVQKELPSEWIKAASSNTSATYGTRFVTDSGKTLNFDQLTPKQQALFHDYQMIQYDITKGGQYSIAAGMQKKS